MWVTGMMAREVMGRGGEDVMELRWRMSEKVEGIKVEEMESRRRRCHGVKDEKEK